MIFKIYLRNTRAETFKGGFPLQCGYLLDALWQFICAVLFSLFKIYLRNIFTVTFERDFPCERGILLGVLD